MAGSEEGCVILCSCEEYIQTTQVMQI